MSDKRVAVSHWINNYVRFLRHTLPHLGDAGIPPASDDWDELQEKAFEWFVINRIGEQHGYWVDLTYGVWSIDESNNRTNGIIVHVKAGSTILFSRKMGPVTQYEECKLNSEEIFHFREFAHPFAEVDDFEKHLSHAGGISSVGLVCAPLSCCDFYVEP